MLSSELEILKIENYKLKAQIVELMKKKVEEQVVPCLSDSDTPVVAVKHSIHDTDENRIAGKKRE